MMTGGTPDPYFRKAPYQNPVEFGKKNSNKRWMARMSPFNSHCCVFPRAHVGKTHATKADFKHRIGWFLPLSHQVMGLGALERPCWVDHHGGNTPRKERLFMVVSQ